jgi:radical SAM superfamily enzyme YgiQ (UPF0313 family)
MSGIVLATINARYVHTAIGLRYLRANLREFAPECQLLEFSLNQRPVDMAEEILALRPRLLGLGVYIWNALPSLELVRLLKQIAPEIVLVLGGPEVSHETREQEICQLADYTICGEGEIAFYELCRQLADGTKPPNRIILADPAPLEQLELPYSLYSDLDIRQRLIHVESTRGCPFSCQFCLSSLDDGIRTFPLQPLMSQFEELIRRGARTLKFVDRSFNFPEAHALELLDFCLARHRPGLVYHFEIVPDFLTPEFLERLSRFPADSLQLELGVQTLNEEVARRIERKLKKAQLLENLRFLKERTSAHLHVDLVAGLPGESLESLSAGFDQLMEFTPHELQLGILKRLRGASIRQHEAPWQMRFGPLPPYALLASHLLDFFAMQRLGRMTRFWDLFYNSRRFGASLSMLWENGHSPFQEFFRFSEWIYETTAQRHAIALDRQIMLLKKYLLLHKSIPETRINTLLCQDFPRLEKVWKLGVSGRVV